VAKSKSAQRARKNSQRGQKRSQQEARRHNLPKVGTRADDAYLRRRRQEDLVDFGLGHHQRRNRLIAIGAIVIALAALAGLLAFLAL
jgi:hypothetical protein